MSAQRLSPRSTRRIARNTGLNVIRAWGHGSYVHQFVTDTHQHGWWDVGTHAWGLYDEPQWHYSSCREMFPDYEENDVGQTRRREARASIAAAYDLDPESLLPNEGPLPAPVEASEEEGKLFTIVVSADYARDLGVANLPHFWRVALADSGGQPIAGVEPTSTLAGTEEHPAFVVAGRALPPNG